MDTARAADVSIWRALQDGLLRGLVRRAVWNVDAGRASASTLLNGFLSPSVRNHANQQFVHPWLQIGSGLPWGMLHHIHMLCCSLTLDGYLEFDDSPEYVTPLKSQPVVELCLRIPTYLTVQAGWDRFIARRAFAAELPEPIATRCTKGGREDHAKRIILDNLPFVREL